MGLVSGFLSVTGAFNCADTGFAGAVDVPLFETAGRARAADFDVALIGTVVAVLLVRVAGAGGMAAFDTGLIAAPLAAGLGATLAGAARLAVTD